MNAFSKKPTASALVPVKGGRQVSIVSNQYSIKLGGRMVVYQYKLEVRELEIWDANLVNQIVKQKRRCLERILGQYVTSGAQLYTITELDESIEMAVVLNGAKYSLVIDKTTQATVTLDDEFQNAQNSVSQAIINIIIKQAFRDTNLRQIGKAPRFFDVKSPLNLPRDNLMIWSGFKASAFQSQVGCTLVMDSIFKFMSTKSCLDRMLEMKDESSSEHQWEQRVKLEFCN